MSAHLDGLSELEFAVRLACTSGKNALAEHLQQCPRGSAQAKVCIAAIAIRDGAPAEGLRLLRHLLTRLGAKDQAALADLILPLLGALNEHDEEEGILDRVTPANAEQQACFEAQRSVIYAIRGDAKASLVATRAAMEIMRTSDDTFRQVTVLIRLSLSAFYRGEGTAALDLALRSGHLAARAGYSRSASIAYTTARAVAMSLLANPRLAMLYAKKSTQFAREGEDVSIVLYGLSSQMLIAAETGNQAALRAITKQFLNYGAPRQYAEDFSIKLSTALPLAWSGDFDTFADIVTTLSPDNNLSERALRDALLAVCALVRHDIVDARRLSRAALHFSRAMNKDSVNHDSWYRLARVIAAYVCIRIGDVHRGERALSSKDLATCAEASLMKTAGEGALIVAGYAKMLRSAERRVHAAKTPLTPSQASLLRKFAAGMSIPEIAVETGRSAATLRSQAQQINIRLGVKGRARAVARARELHLV